MSKFLDLINEFNRSISVEPTPPAGNLMTLFTKLCNTLHVDCERTDNGLLIKIPTEEENQDITKYTSTNAIDNNVERLAAKPGNFGTNAGQANQAVNDRKQLAPDMVKTYKTITNQIKAALNNINNPTSI